MVNREVVAFTAYLPMDTSDMSPIQAGRKATLPISQSLHLTPALQLEPQLNSVAHSQIMIA
jgi:hypothetical protein